MSKPTLINVSDEQWRVLYEIRNKLAKSEFPHENDYMYNVLNGLIKDLKIHSILTIKKDSVLRWRRAKAGRNFGKDTVIIPDGENDARLVRCAVYDCKYIYVEDLLKLPIEE